MGARSKPPQSVEELLERYAVGERDFRGACLAKADLQHANLNDAWLNVADLSEADLQGANLVQGCLRGANLRGANLSDANISSADLIDADLCGTRLNGAQGYYTDFGRANLQGAQLLKADLSGASFSEADLRDADLRGSYLGFVNMVDASISGADCGGVQLAGTFLHGVDLVSLCDAVPPTVHRGPSYVDYKSISLSLHSTHLKEFLQRTGMPEVFVEYMIDCARTLDPKGIFKMLQSTFISYGGPDTAFAQQLNDALLKNGVTTFFFAKDAIPGKKLHRLMREGVNQHDRVILICSKASLDRPGVLNEITETLQRESRDGGKAYLIPITLDDHVFSGWKPEDPGVAQAIRDRVVADFRGAATDPAKFNDGVLRLIAALKK
jgi:TIR domain/Pentapeptide repeats (8 copies)